MLRTSFALIATSFALSACLGSSGNSGSASSRAPTTPALPETESMPTSGSAVYSGAVNFYGDGTEAFPAQMSLRANFAEGGGTVTEGRLSNIQGATGEFTQSNDVAITGSRFSGMELTGEASAGGGTLTSGGDAIITAAGSFEGENAAQVSVNFGGAYRASDDIDPQLVNALNNSNEGGILIQQPAP